MDKLYYEDFEPGMVFDLPATPIDRDEAIDYAREFDPQPFHLDEAAARETLLGGLALSGWNTCCIGMRMAFEGAISRFASLGAPGVDEGRWLKPVRPGDVLTGKLEIVEKRRSRSRPERGIIKIRMELVNQEGDAVYRQSNSNFVLCREPAA